MYIKSMPIEMPRVEQEKNLLIWKAPARPFKRMDKQTLTVPVVIAILVGIVMLIAGEWMIIALIAAIVFAYYAWSTVAPDEMEYLITNRGLRVHGKFYPWEVLARWWIENKTGENLLMVETPVGIAGRVVLPLGKTDPKSVERVMREYLLFEKPLDTSLEKAGKWLSDKFPLAEKV